MYDILYTSNKEREIKQMNKLTKTKILFTAIDFLFTALIVWGLASLIDTNVSRDLVGYTQSANYAWWNLFAIIF